LYQHISLAAYTTALKDGQTSCEAVVAFYLDRIQSQQHLNAFTHVYAEAALQKAKQLDADRHAGQPMGKLHGVVVAIKDVIVYEGHPATAASKMLKDFHSIYSSTAVQRLLQEEAIIIGNCNCDEFAMGSTNENSAYGPVLNAADNGRVSGGSSGGSAVAVQAALCMVSLGSDTGGSVRQPADFCGLVGLKPTYGRVSRYGLIAYASSFDQIGVFANNVDDAALLLEVIGGADEFDSTVSHLASPFASSQLAAPKQPLRIAYLQETLSSDGLDVEIKQSMVDFIAQQKNNGHVVEPVSFSLLDYIVPTYYVLTTAEASTNLSRFDGVRYGHRSKAPAADLVEFYKNNRSEGFSQEVQRRILLGTFVLSAGYYDAYYTKAQQVRQLLLQQTNQIFEQYDFILMPVSPGTAFKLGEKMDDPIAMYMADIFTVYANLVGLPAVAMPLFKHSNGMPFGLQLHGKKFEEAALLSAAKLLMG
jgi:aspartyl-tRNA(Asn)/glutamyl-tRNA(Gln) amidotransferase subunit A